MSTIEPIPAEQQQQVVDRAAELLQQCEQHFERSFKPIDIHFNLRGRTSGMYVLKRRQRYLRFNPFIFAKFFDDSLSNTVPHEVAHYVADMLFGFKNIRPHGKEWRAVMQSLGVAPQVTGDYDLSGIAVKRQRRFDYACDCTTHALTTVRHNRIVNNNARYLCRKCGVALRQSLA